jgi:cytochrome c oxidase assembly factor CtaG
MVRRRNHGVALRRVQMDTMDWDSLRILFAEQLKDPFRIGLMLALAYTTVQQAKSTGWILPPVMGSLFFGYILAMYFPKSDHTVLVETLVGAVTNGLLVGVALITWRAMVREWNKKQPPM